MRVSPCAQNGLARHARWLLGAGILLILPPEIRSDSHALFVPHLRVGQMLQYKSVARIKRHTKTTSRVATLAQPGESQIELSTNIRLTVREVRMEAGRLTVAVHAELETPTDAVGANPATVVKGKLDFTIAGDGHLSRLEGLDDLDPEQRIAWQFWISQFAYGWALPANGVKVGEKWKTEEVENTPTPIANLAWERETTYVRNDKCPVIPAETCAVFLTRARLKQKSQDKDATPEDYRLHNLKTSGIAKGTNETITYISLKTRLVLRATEDVQQALDATVAKADDSNQVRYQVETNSQFETVFVPASSSVAH